MSIVSKIRLPIDIQPEERQHTSRLFIHSFILGLSTALFFVAANANFIKLVPLSNIPLAYVAAGAIGLLLVALFKFLQRTQGVFASYVSTLVLFATITIGLFVLYHYKVLSSITLAYTSFILIYPFSVLFVLGFSGIGLRLFNLSQSKRLTALVGTGEVVASIMGYMLVPILAKMLPGLEWLFAISAVVIFASLVPLYSIRKRAPVLNAANHVKQVAVQWGVLKHASFYKYIAVFTFFSVTAVYISDYAYLLATRKLSVITTWEVSLIISVVFTAIKLGELLFSFLSGNIITRKGMRFSLLLLPFMLTVIAVCALLSKWMMDDAAFFIIIFFMLNKWCERVIRKGITIPALKVLYQVTPAEERVQLQTLLEGMVNQLATIAVGLLLFLITLSLPANDPLGFLEITVYISVFLLAFWLVVSSRLYQQYKLQIQVYMKRLGQQQHHHSKEVVLQLNTEAVIENYLKRAFEGLNLQSKAALYQLLSNYHPAFASPVQSDMQEVARLSKFYFQDDYHYTRWLLIQCIPHLPQGYQQQLAREWFEVSSLPLRCAIVDVLLSSSVEDVPVVEMQRFWENQLQPIVGEIAWVTGALNDIGNESTEAIQPFKLYLQQQQLHLLQVLKLLYGKSTMQMIEDIVMADVYDAENSLFAIELLENTLSDEVKPYVLPVFETSSYILKKQAWRHYYYLHHGTLQQRMQAYMMRDYKLISATNKYFMLKQYAAITNDASFIQAFAANQWYFIATEAKAILQKKENATDKLRQQWTAEWPEVLRSLHEVQLVTVQVRLFQRATNTTTNRHPYNTFAIEKRFPTGWTKTDVLGLAIELFLKGYTVKENSYHTPIEAVA